VVQARNDDDDEGGGGDDDLRNEQPLLCTCSRWERFYGDRYDEDGQKLRECGGM